MVETSSDVEIPSISRESGMNPTEKHTLSTFEAGAEYIGALEEAGLLYHFDDDAADALRAHNLSQDDIEAIEHNVRQLFDIDWTAGGYECPFDYVVGIE